MGRGSSLEIKKGNKQGQQVHPCPPGSCPGAALSGLCHAACEVRETGWGPPERVVEPAALGAVPV